jgi:signal peptidase I
MHRLPGPIKKTLSILSQVFFVLIMLVGSGIIFHNVYYTPIKIVGASMEPTLFNNEFGIMDDHASTLSSLKRFDIIVIQQNPNINRYIIKRILALPGETIHFTPLGALRINGEMIEQSFYKNDTYERQTCGIMSMLGCQEPYSLGEDDFYVLGDNRSASLDSRTFGAIQTSMIVGQLIAIEGYCSTINGSQNQGVDLSNCASRTYTWPRLFV